MKYTRPVNIAHIDDTAWPRMQPGQWVYDGQPMSRGRFMGVSRAGTVVVAWHKKSTDVATLRKLSAFARR